MDTIIEEMKAYLRGKDYDKLVELAVVRMGEVFSGKVLERPFNYGLIIFCGGGCWALYRAQTRTRACKVYQEAEENPRGKRQSQSVSKVL